VEPVVAIRGLTKVYRSFGASRGVLALNDLNLDIQPGEMFAIVGPNGSGKTTTLKILTGLLFPTSGTATIFGRRVADIEVKRRIGFMPEAPYFYDHLTGEELLAYYSGLFGLGKALRRDRVDELLGLVGMQERRAMPLRQYSRGMLQRIGLAQALINDPSLLILDEPTSGLDPIGAYQIRALISEMRRRGKTILLCSHLLNEVEAMCDRVGVLHRGNLLAVGAVAELLPETEAARIVAARVSDEAVEKIRALDLHPSVGDGLVSLEAPDRAAINRVIDLVRTGGGEILEVARRRPTLEEFFIEAVGARREE
jgi:ABC-2 type transport system ATP-binding protein